MEASTISVSQPRWKTQPKKIEFLLWLLCCIPLIHVLLLTVIEPNTINAFLIHSLRPVGVMGAMLVFVFSGFHARDSARRWAWWCQAIAMVFSLAFSTMRITQIATPAVPLMKLLATMIYLLGLSTIALYLQGYSMQLGSIVRVFVGGSTIGFATLIFGLSILPQLLPEWGTPPSSYIPFISLDAGILFAILVVGLRYGLDKPHMPILWLSLACLLIGDTLQAVLIWRNAVGLYWMVFPVTTLHNILLSMAAYRDVTYVARSPEAGSSSRPLREWLLWTSFPLGVVLATFLISSLIGNVPPIFIFSLGILAIIHEIWAASDYRRVLQNLRLTYSQLQQQAEKEAVMEERHRLARELHDSTCQLLYGQTLIANAGLEMISRGDLQQSAEHMTRLRDVAQGVHRDMRLLLYELRPPLLGENSLLEVLRQRLEGVERRAGIDATLVVEGGRLPTPVEEAFYRVAWEALNNASKYAAATSVKVLIRTEGGRVELEVADNGQGFDLEAASQRGGLGLMTMHERLEKLGGALMVISSPGKGTQVKATLELDENVSWAG